MQKPDHQKLIAHISLSLRNRKVDDDQFEETKAGHKVGSHRDNVIEEPVSSEEHSVTETEDVYDKHEAEHRELADSGEESGDSVEFIKPIDEIGIKDPNISPTEESKQ